MPSIAGELISSEIEIRSGRGADVDDARTRQAEARRRLFALARAHGVGLGATGTHPLSDYREQHIIDTEHYQRVEDGLKYVAWRNNTFSVHVHVGVRGADRAVRVCDRLRPILPDAARDQRQLALRRRARLGPALRAHPDLHQVVPALRDPRRLRVLARVGRVRRPARPHRLDRRVHAALVVRAPAPRLRHRRGADLRRADDRGRVRRPRRPDRRLRAAGGGGGRRGRGAARPARPAARGERLAGDPPRARRAAARPRGVRGIASRSTRRPRRSTGSRPGRAPTSCCPSSTGRSASGA